MRFIGREERQQLLDAEAERQRAHADLWHTNMDNAAVARFLKQRRFDPAIPPDRPAEDLAEARDLAALSALAQRAPGFAAARSLIEFVRVEGVPIGANLEPTVPPIASVAEAFNWYSDHPDGRRRRHRGRRHPRPAGRALVLVEGVVAPVRPRDPDSVER